MQNRWVRFLALALVTGYTLSSSSHLMAGAGDTFHVTNGNNSGPGSLRDAVAQAEASSGPGEKQIFIDSALVPSITLTTGPIEISDPRIVAITGSTTSQPPTIDAAQASRLFVITAPDSELKFEYLVLQNGRTSASAGPVATCAPGTGRGGAICSLGAVTLRQVSLINNATLGAGAHGGALFAEGRVELSDRCPADELCRYSNNTTAGAGAHGGAIYSNSVISVEFPSFEGNHAFVQNHALGPAGRGGAIHARRAEIQLNGGNGSIASRDRTTLRFAENSADTGGAIAIDCASEPFTFSFVEQVDFVDNTALRAGGAIALVNQCGLLLRSVVFERNQCLDFGGGGIFSDHEIDLRSVRMENNECAGPGGAIRGSDVRLTRDNAFIGNSTTGAGHHGGAIAATVLLMRDSSVTGNRTFGTDANGGGIWVTQSSDIGNSTISQNVADDGDTARGGGIFYSGSGQNLVINSSTVVGNDGADGGDGIFIAGDPGGSDIGLTLASTVLAGNGSDNIQVEAIGAGSMIDVVQSVFGDNGAEITGLNVANLFTNDPELGPLADNGCRNLSGNWAGRACAASHAPLPTSLVIDAGDNPAGFASDQRGFTFPRTFGPASDIGAIENNPDPSLSFSPAMIDFGTFISGDPLPLPRIITVSNDGPGILFIEDAREDNPAFNVQLGDCGDAVLLAGQSCGLVVEVDPPPDGEIISSVSIWSDDPQSPTAVPVRVFASTGAELVLDRMAIDFGDVPLGTPSPVEMLMLENVGVRPLAIANLLVLGDGFALIGEDCGNELAAGATCTMQLQFTPGSVGIASGILQFLSNSIVGSALTQIELSGSSGMVFLDGFEG